MTRVFFTTDLHGSEMCFKKFLKAGEFYKADVVIMGGDTTGKMVVPIIKTKESYRSYYLDKETILKDEREIREYEGTIKDAGYYPVYLNEDEFNIIQGDEEKIDKLFHKLMLETTGRWISLAEEKIPTNIKCIIAPGNDDAFEIDEIIKKSNRIIYGEGRVVRIDKEHEMLSVGWTNPTPWNTPRECSEEELKEKIEELIPNVQNMKNCIFNLHAPPYGSGLDLAPELTDGDKVVRGGYIKKSVGSKAVAEAIEKYQPLLALHGHIHESKAVQRINRTLCINPGSMYGDSILCGVIINLKDGEIESYATTTG